MRTLFLIGTTLSYSLLEQILLILCLIVMKQYLWIFMMVLIVKLLLVLFIVLLVEICCISMSNFNFNETEHFLNTDISHYQFLVVTHSTRSFPTTCTLMDNIFVNNPIQIYLITSQCFH